MYSNDNRTVLTLDAGGTNFVFSAIRGQGEIIDPITLPSCAHDLNLCLDTIVTGFRQVMNTLASPPVAISFAFPGPADYENGVIGDLLNLPSFRGGIALGPFLEKTFDLPVYINNDGNLFAYGEALAGSLPEINSNLEAAGSRKRYKNLLAVTIGTGFGGGVVINNNLLLGDNGCGGDVWLSAHVQDFSLIAEEGVSIRAVIRRYRELSGSTAENLTPKDIFNIAEGNLDGDQKAAIASFEDLGRAAGFTIGESLNIVDGLVVVGGGIAHAQKYFLPALVQELNGTRKRLDGPVFPKLQMKAFNLLNEQEYREFTVDDSRTVTIPGTDEQVPYQVSKKTGVTVSKLGTSKAVSLGAYAYALARLDAGE
jgi:glucokinase